MSEDHGTQVQLSVSAVAFDELAAQISEARAIDRATFDMRYQVPFEALGYDPLTAVNLDQIQQSDFALDAKGLEILATQGFVIDRGQSYGHFADGLERIYTADLPVYVSADAILEAVHKSYDDILLEVERDALIPALRKLLSELSVRLKTGQGTLGESRQDLDLYLSVALAMLNGTTPSTMEGTDEELAERLVKAAQNAEGLEMFDLFGVRRTEDFSQFKPRGHYEDGEDMQRYFRALMWLGRVDLRLIETQGDGSTVFHRRQFDAMMALYDLFEPNTLELFSKIDGAIQEFVGESDYMVLGEIAGLLEALGVKTPADTAQLGDQVVAQTIAEGGFGTQRIASHFMLKGPAVGTLPLNRSFALLGQRYVVDSHVFSNVVYDRVLVEGVPSRMMPNPLDVAFAVFENDQAAGLLKSELDTYAYHGALNGMRVAVDAHGDDYWQENLYNSWLLALRGLSPTALPAEAPAPMKSEGWGRRMLNAQLASWAELRHDTLLYAKQSYTLGITCEFPDGYVDPYPSFYAALVNYAARGLSMADRLEGTASAQLVDRLRDHFTTLKATLSTLQGMAEHELTGVPFNAEQFAFLNDAVRYDTNSGGCGGPQTMLGWYPRMLFNNEQTFDPTIADVHTQPTEHDTIVGKVLHVGTGAPRAAVITVNTCEGARAYVGMVSSYHEHITKDFVRLGDSEWAAQYAKQKPADVPWLAPVLY